MLENDSMKWSKVIKAQLEKHFLTQEQFAEKCNVSQKAVSLWINNRSTPSKIYQKKILQVIKELDKEVKVNTAPRLEFSNEEIFLLHTYRLLTFYKRQSVLKFIKFLQDEKDVELLFQNDQNAEAKGQDSIIVTTTGVSSQPEVKL